MKPRPLRRLGWFALLLVLLAAAFAVARYYDDAVIRWMRSSAAPEISNRESIRPWLEGLLNATPYVCIPAILMAFPNWKRLLAGWTLPMLLMLGLTHGLKLAIGRARPLLDMGDSPFDPFCGREDMNSFPSGHTATVVTMALLLGMFFPRGRIAFYFFAACVAFQRIVSDAHFPSDLVGGVAVAALSVWSSWKMLGPRFYELQ